MEPQELDEELTIDLKKIFKTLWSRKKEIFLTFVLITGFFIALTFILPKKYTVTSDLYINKTGTTNLSDLNPFVIADQGVGPGFAGVFSGGNSGLNDELEIIQSSLVIDRVIKENDLKIKKGKKAGEYISTAAFLKKNISIENKKGTKVISITYKNKDPKVAYNVVKSIINNYQLVNETLNTQKASSDKKLMEESLKDVNKELNLKIAEMKKSGAMPNSTMMGQVAVMQGYNKAISSALNTVANQAIEGQKRQIAVDAEVEKLKMVKSKLEWSTLVEQMAKNATNVTILKEPEQKRDFEFSEPKLLINIILGLVFSLIASLVLVILLENTDKKMTYSTLGEKVLYDLNKNTDDLKILLLASPEKSFTVLAFDGFNTGDMQSLSAFSNLKIITADISPQTVDNIKRTDNIILASKIGRSSRKLYLQLKNICQEMKKDIYLEIV